MQECSDSAPLSPIPARRSPGRGLSAARLSSHALYNQTIAAAAGPPCSPPLFPTNLFCSCCSLHAGGNANEVLAAVNLGL